MKDIELNGNKRKGRVFSGRLMWKHTPRKTFGCLAARIQKANLAFRDDMVGVIIDRFEKNITILSLEERKDWSKTIVNLTLTNQFFG